MQTLRIGVLMGGKSIEREVSFNSGRTVCDHLDTHRYTIVPLFQHHNGNLFLLPWHFLHRGKISDFESRLMPEAQSLTWDTLKEYVDFIYIAMHGRFAEDGTLQGMLEILGIPYLGSKVLPSALGMHKTMQKQLLHAHGIATPRGITLSPHEIERYAVHQDQLFARLQEAALQLPYVVKPQGEGSSLGVSIIHDRALLIDALLHAATINPGKRQPVIIEATIEGMEFSCISIVDHQTGEWFALPPTEIVPEHTAALYDYEQKYMPGRAFKCTPARCSQGDVAKIQAACVQASKALGFSTISRIDGFLTYDGCVVITDPNTLSGMSPSSYLFNQAAEIGMSHAAIINYLIETELRAYGMMDTHMHTQRADKGVDNQTQVRVAVLLGGNSGEREISLESGRNIVYKLSPHKYKALPLFVDEQMHLYTLTQAQLVRGSTKEIASTLTDEARVSWHDLPTIVDFVFIALHGGKGENGSVQGALEMLGLPYNGSSVLTSALCMDKYKTTQYLDNQGFDVPRSILIDREAWFADQEEVLRSIAKELNFPCIIKPHDDGCSIMVSKVPSIDQLAEHITTFFASDRKHALLEEYIRGMELTVGVIGNDAPRALPPSKAVALSDVLSIQEKFLPGAGENITPAPLPTHALRLVQETIEHVYKALECKGYARIDCFFQSVDHSPTGKDRVIILEINTLPGMTPATCIFHQAAEIGMRPMDFIDHIITLGLQEHMSQQSMRHSDTRLECETNSIA